MAYTPKSGKTGKQPLRMARRGPSPAVWAAIIAALVLLALLAFLVWSSMQPTRAPLPQAEVSNLPRLPSGPSVTQAEQMQLPNAPPLTQAEQQQLPSGPPVTQAEAPPQASGVITWEWALYKVNPTVLGVPMGEQMPGHQFVAVGVTIYNQSSVSVDVDHNAFRLTVDRRVYTTDVWSSANAVVGGMPFLGPTTLLPNATLDGFTGFMIPEQYQSAMADWQPRVPPTVEVRRIDPATTQPESTGLPQPEPPSAPWDDEEQ